MNSVFHRGGNRPEVAIWKGPLWSNGGKLTGLPSGSRKPSIKHVSHIWNRRGKLYFQFAAATVENGRYRLS